jgi:type I restriction enzyme, S subunit
MSTPMPTATLAEVAELNPPLAAFLSDGEEVSFMPMSAVDAESVNAVDRETRLYAEVSKGYAPFLDGDVLIAKITPCFENGKIAHAHLTRRYGFGSTEFHVVRPRTDRADARYLVHYLRQDRIRRQGKSRMTGSAGQRRVPEHFLAGLTVPVPPLPEQRRIAEILDKADALRAKRRAALAQLDTLTQSIFLDMFGDPATNPKGWPIKLFSAVCETRLGKMLDQKQQTGQHRRPYLRNANVQWFRFDLKSVFEMDFDQDDRETFRLRPGDLLICEGGEPGRSAVWRGEIAECYFQKALHRARPDPRTTSAEYLSWLMWFLAQRGKLRGVTSATIAHLTGEKLAVLPVMLPAILVQQDFARHVVAVERLRSAHYLVLTELDALFASLQHRAFRGEL